MGSNQAAKTAKEHIARTSKANTNRLFGINSFNNKEKARNKNNNRHEAKKKAALVNPEMERNKKKRK
ncbi:hypothetical protein KJ605_02065, partial [Patescibacteria group bacterium]|nr:hypothetical protein [Patescibacteria group bacterium]MBU1970537.1 hypothetical protein [Patescibacteria group bacterium]